MTTIAEERAKELSRYVAAEIDAGGLDVGTLEALLICAFENAQNDKLEEAARAASGAARASYYYVSQNRADPFNQGVRAAEQAVLALKKD